MQNRAVTDDGADCSWWITLGSRFYRPRLRDEGPHPRISGEGRIQIQGGVKAGRIMQDLMMGDKRKEREALAHPGRSKHDLDTTSWEGRALNSLAPHPWHQIRPPIKMKPRHPHKNSSVKKNKMRISLFTLQACFVIVFLTNSDIRKKARSGSDFN